jgi:RNA polymerase sigma factor (sigma-70 family)
MSFEDIFTQHYRENFNSLVNSAARWVGHHNAEDIVQEAYARAWEYQSSFVGAGVVQFPQWFSRILHNSRSDHMAMERTQGMTYLPQAGITYEEATDETPAADDVERLTITYARTKQVKGLIKAVPNEKHRGVLTMFFFNGNSHEEIAKQLKIANGTSRWVVSEFRKSLEKLGIS